MTAAWTTSSPSRTIDQIEAMVEERRAVSLRVPVTAIYSRRDGVVAWQACIDPAGGGPIEHIEVDATHVGLGFGPASYRLVARSLSASVSERSADAP